MDPHTHDRRRVRNHCLVSFGIIATGLLALYAPHLHEAGLMATVAVNLFWIWAE